MLRRYTPLRRSWIKRSNKPMRRTPLNKKSAKQKEIDRIWKKVTDERIAKVDGICEFRIIGICARYATTGHHKQKRSQGGAHTKKNCIVGCWPCHDFVELHEQWAIEQGFTISKKSGFDSD